jgi:oligopeptidase B
VPDTAPQPEPADVAPAAAPAAPAATPSAAPVAERRPTERTHHGHTFVDDYEWLRDGDDPAVVAHLEAETAWAEARTAHLAPLRERLFAEIKERTLETDLSVPVRQGGYWYYSRTVEGAQYPIHARVPAQPGDRTPPRVEPGEIPDGEQVLLDENAEARGHDFFSLGGSDVSADGSRLLYQVDTQGDERYVLRLRDLTTGEELPDVVEDTAPGATFTPDGAYVFYLTVDEAWRPDKVWRHRVGTPVSDDVVVFHEPDERFWVGVGVTRSERFVVIESAAKLTSEVRLVDVAAPEATPRVVWARREGVEYTVEHAVLPGGDGADGADGAARDVLLVLHNDGAENFELVVTPVPGLGTDGAGADEATRPDGGAGAPLDPADAVVVLPHDPAVRLDAVEAFATHVVLGYRREALTRVGVVDVAALARAAVGAAALDAASGVVPTDVPEPLPVRELELDEPLFTVGLGASPEWDQPAVRVVTESFVRRPACTTSTWPPVS